MLSSSVGLVVLIKLYVWCCWLSCVGLVVLSSSVGLVVLVKFCWFSCVE